MLGRLTPDVKMKPFLWLCFLQQFVTGLCWKSPSLCLSDGNFENPLNLSSAVNCSWCCTLHLFTIRLFPSADKVLSAGPAVSAALHFSQHFSCHARTCFTNLNFNPLHFAGRAWAKSCNVLTFFSSCCQQEISEEECVCESCLFLYFTSFKLWYLNSVSDILYATPVLFVLVRFK